MGIYSDYEIENNILLENANKDTNEFLSFAKIFIMHLLKYAYQPQRQTKSWINSIKNSYNSMNSKINNSILNSLNNEVFDNTLNKSLNYAIKETNLAISKFNLEEFKSYYSSFESLMDKTILIAYLNYFNYNNDLRSYINSL